MPETCDASPQSNEHGETIRLCVNGTWHTLAATWHAKTLLEFLRGPAQLCGTKEGCAEGDCGACTVLVNDSLHTHVSSNAPNHWKSINACIAPLAALDGQSILTIESVAQAGPPHPICDAMIKRGGAQCGFCTPGIVMSLCGLYQDAKPKTSVLVEDALVGNLCRCTGYLPIRDATNDINEKLIHAPAENKSGTSDNVKLPILSPLISPRCPQNLDELWRVWEQQPDAKLVAGGTDLMLRRSVGHENLGRLIAIEHIQELQAIAHDESTLRWGAAVSLERFRIDCQSHLPTLADYLDRFASKQIRNRGSIGGNLVTASPIGDLAPPLLALDARVQLRRRDGSRSVKLEDFFTGYRSTCLGQSEDGLRNSEQEILERIEVPVPADSVRLFFYKISKRPQVDISALSFALALHFDAEQKITGIRLALGGVADRPLLLRGLDTITVGHRYSKNVAEALADFVEQQTQPLSDHRASAWYRKQVTRQLFFRVLDRIRDSGREVLA